MTPRPAPCAAFCATAGQQRGWQPPGRAALAVVGGRASVLPAVVSDLTGADIIVGGGPVLLASGTISWRESLAQGNYTGLQPTTRLARAAVGVRADGMVVAMVVATLSFQGLAEVLFDRLNCRDAMALGRRRAG